MQQRSGLLALAALIVALAALFRPSNVAPASASLPADPWKAERHFPPLVFSSKATLECSISSTQNGRQVMTTTSGQGFNFATAMKPIKKSLVELKGKGMKYSFDAYPTSAVPASFAGLGKGTITEMKAEIAVDVRRYQQPGGAGTEINFTAADISPDSAYVEFTGIFVRLEDKKRFPFRVVYGNVADGGGKVLPVTRDPRTHILAKTVMLGTPRAAATVTTALYEAEEGVETLH